LGGGAAVRGTSGPSRRRRIIGSPWENGYIESFNGKLRDELFAREQFNTLLEAKVLIERWRRHYNTVRPHSSLGYRAPEAAARGHVRPLCFAYTHSP